MGFGHLVAHRDPHTGRARARCGVVPDPTLEDLVAPDPGKARQHLHVDLGQSVVRIRDLARIVVDPALEGAVVVKADPSDPTRGHITTKEGLDGPWIDLVWGLV